MNEAENAPESEALSDAPAAAKETTPPGAEAESSPAGMPAGSGPIESRFLFVDVAAQRAKQLRRGAVPRIENLPEPNLDNPRSLGNRLKLERVAMREVDAGKIIYQVPEDDDDPAKTD